MAKKEPTLKEVIAGLKEQNQKQINIVDGQAALLDIDKKIANLQKDSNAERQNSLDAIAEQFSILSDRFENNSGIVKEQARLQIEELANLVQSEEEIREKQRAMEEQTNSNLAIVDGLKGLQESLNGMVDKAAKGAGILGVAMLLFDPELLMDILFGALELFQKSVETLSVYFKEYISPIIESIGAETLLFAGGLIWLATKFGLLNKIAQGFSLVVSAWKWAQISLQKGLLFQAKELIKTATGKVAAGVMSAIKWVGRGIQAVGLFMTGTVFPAIVTALSAASAVILPFLVAAAPFIAIGAAIGAAITAIVQGFEKAVAVFDETGSLSEAIATFALDVITAPLRWLKSLTSWILGALGFEGAAAALDEFDITATLIGGLKSMFTSAITWINETFGIDIVASIQSIWDSVTDGMGFIGLITAPIRAAGDWIASMFGWEAPEDSEEGFVTALVRGWIDEFTNWLAGILDIDFASFVPDWAKKFIPGMDEEDEPKTKERSLVGKTPEELRQMAEDNAGWFGDVGEEYRKLTKLQRAQEKERKSNSKEQSLIEEPKEQSLIGKTPEELRQMAEDNAGWFGDADEEFEKLMKVRKQQRAQEKENAPGSDLKNFISPGIDKIGEKGPTVKVMTKDGFKELTKREIQNGMDQRDIKFSLGRKALRQLEMKEKAVDSVEKATVASPIRDTQVENNALKDQEASASIVAVQAPAPAPAPAPAANVSSTSVNMTNSLDQDRLTREFMFSPASAMF